jgi:hypothetical protein
MADGEAAEEEGVSYNFDDVVGGEQEKQQAGHPGGTPGLAGSDVKKARQSVCQRNVIHNDSISNRQRPKASPEDSEHLPVGTLLRRKVCNNHRKEYDEKQGFPANVYTRGIVRLDGGEHRDEGAMAR